MPREYHISLFITTCLCEFFLLFHSLSYGCFIWFGNSAGSCSKEENGHRSDHQPLSFECQQYDCVNWCSILGQGKICCLFPYRFGCFFHVPDSNYNWVSVPHIGNCHLRAFTRILVPVIKCILHLNAHSEILIRQNRQKDMGDCTTVLLLLLRQIWLSSPRFLFRTVTCIVVPRTVVQSPQWLSAVLGLIMKCFFVLTALPEQDLCSSQIWPIPWYHSLIKLQILLISDCSKMTECNV